MGNQTSLSGQRASLEDFDFLREIGKGAFGKVVSIKLKHFI